LGVAEDDRACPHYAPRTDDPGFTQQTRLAVGSLTKPDYHSFFREILGERFTVERDLVKALDEVDRILQQQGSLNEEMDGDLPAVEKEFLVGRTDLLLDFYVLHRMALALGLGVYAEDIVRAEIARRMVAKPPGRK
jgi:hypothetical protein